MLLNVPEAWSSRYFYVLWAFLHRGYYVPRSKLRRLKVVEHFETQEKFAFKSGLDEAVVSKLIRGVRRPTVKQRMIFEALLKTPATNLFPLS